jgi:hypothetical protein
MKREIGVVLLGIGIFLTVYVVNASNSFSSGAAPAVADSPTNRALCLLLGAAISTLLGAVMSTRKPGKSR